MTTAVAPRRNKERGPGNREEPLYGNTGAGIRDRDAATKHDAGSSHEVATTYLVRSCERALFELRCSLGETTRPAEVRVGLEAAALLEQVLAGWRDTLQQLQAATGGRPG